MSRFIDVSNLDIPSDENDYDELVAFADKVAKMITDAPSIDIEPKRGEWIRSSDIDIAWGSKVYTCSNCGHKRNSKTNFCPNCGADMRKREGE